MSGFGYTGGVPVRSGIGECRCREHNVEGAFIGHDGQRHRVLGESNRKNWHKPGAPTVRWDLFALCGAAVAETALSTAVRPITCVACRAATEGA